MHEKTTTLFQYNRLWGFISSAYLSVVMSDDIRCFPSVNEVSVRTKNSRNRIVIKSDIATEFAGIILMDTQKHLKGMLKSILDGELDIVRIQ